MIQKLGLIGLILGGILLAGCGSSDNGPQKTLKGDYDGPPKGAGAPAGSDSPAPKTGP